MNAVAMMLATAGYVGYFPIAPGTAGSLAGLVVYMLVRWIDVPAFELAMIGLVLILGIWSASIAERRLNLKDPGPVVIDEVLGMLITLALLPLSLAGVLVGFVLFRIFDVVKPYPASRLEALHGGLGIMLDDAVAGLYAYVSLRALLALAPSWLAA
jgi:phosphatidylglycerophosphatase A